LLHALIATIIIEMKKWIVLISVLIIVVAGGVAFYFFSQPPKDGLSDEFKKEAVTKLLGRKAQLTRENIPDGNVAFEGESISFLYPARAIPYEYREESSQKNTNVIEDFSFDMKDPKIIFSLKVASNTSGINDVSDIPAGRLRQDRSGEYIEEKEIIGGEAIISFYKQTREPEKTGFIITPDRIYTISITGNIAEEVESLFDTITSTIELR